VPEFLVTSIFAMSWKTGAQAMLVHFSAALIGPDPDFNVRVSPGFVDVLHRTRTSALQISRKYG
jgi:hypothetical protein